MIALPHMTPRIHTPKGVGPKLPFPSIIAMLAPRPLDCKCAMGAEKCPGSPGISCEIAVDTASRPRLQYGHLPELLAPEVQAGWLGVRTCTT